MTRRLAETHHARWMGNLLHILKMLICSKLFQLGPQQLVDVIAHSFYIVFVHVFYWFSATLMADIPFLTLSLRQDLVAWQSRDRDAARTALRKIDLHTEYLSGRSVILALASEKVNDETKSAMAQALLASDRTVTIEKGKPFMPRVYDESKIEDFVNHESWLIFKVKMLKASYISFLKHQTRELSFQITLIIRFPSALSIRANIPVQTCERVGRG